MNEEQLRHQKTKKTLKIVGITLISVGFICTIIGFVSFFNAFGTGEFPKLFFFAFIGLPMLGIGGGITLFGFKSEITRYSTNERVPVINDMAKDISPAVRELAGAVKDGINQDSQIKCRKCGELNKLGSKFCNGCGSKLE